MKLFDKKLYMCKACHKHLNQNEIYMSGILQQNGFLSFTRGVGKFQIIEKSFNFQEAFV